MNQLDLRATAKLLLDDQLSRRDFLARIAKAGIATAAASTLADSLAADESVTERARKGRVVSGMTGGEAMAEFLIDWKVPYVFGLGGSEEVGFLDALVDRTSLQYVLSLHEASVMSMADGYARSSGQIPIINLHSVAGAAYALSPMVNAFKDRTPMVVTVGRQTTTVRGTNAFLEAVNLHKLPGDYAQWTWDVMSVNTIPDVLRRAFMLAETPPGGPTFVTFSKDLWEVPIEPTEIIPRDRSVVSTRVEPTEEQVEQIADVLAEATFPVISVGKEASRSNPSAEVAAIAELLGAPVFHDLRVSHAPLTFPMTHPQYAGRFRQDREYPERVDVYWNLGGVMYSPGALPREAVSIHTGLDAAEIGRTYPVDLAVMANVKDTASAVLEALRNRRLSRSVVEDRRRNVLAYHQIWRQRHDTRVGEKWDRSPIASERVLVELDRRMDPEAIVVSEIVTSEDYLEWYLTMDHRAERTRRNLTSTGGVLGWGIPAAVGAKIGAPDYEVWALVGDGCFQWGVHGLWSAARYEVPIGVVVWNNGQYQSNRRFLHAYSGRAAATGKYIGCDFRSPDIDHVALANGYGVEAERVEEPAQIGPALERCRAAMTTGRPYVVEIKVERFFGGADSDWHDFFSVAKGQPRSS